MANKLELTWYGKDKPIIVEPRLLIEDATRSNCAADPDTENMLIHGDNLLALKALENKFSGSIKTIYIRTVKKHCSKVQIIQQKAAQKVQVIWNLVSDCAANGSYLCNSLFDLRVLEDA